MRIMRMMMWGIIAAMVGGVSVSTSYADMLFVSDTVNGRVSFFDADTGGVSPIGNLNLGAGFTPQGIAISGNTLYVVANNTTAANSRVLTFNLATGGGPTVFSGTLGAFGRDIVIRGDGSLLVSLANNTLVQVSTGGTVSAFVSTGSGSNPSGLALSGNTLYVGLQGTDVIQVRNATTGAVITSYSYNFDPGGTGITGDFADLAIGPNQNSSASGYDLYASNARPGSNARIDVFDIDAGSPTGILYLDTANNGRPAGIAFRNYTSPTSTSSNFLAFAYNQGSNHQVSRTTGVAGTPQTEGTFSGGLPSVGGTSYIAFGPNVAPEPATLALFGLVGTGLGYYGWRQRKAKRQVAA